MGLVLTDATLRRTRIGLGATGTGDAARGTRRRERPAAWKSTRILESDALTSPGDHLPHPPHIPPSPGVTQTTATQWTRGELQAPHGQQAAVSKQAHMGKGVSLQRRGRLRQHSKAFTKTRDHDSQTSFQDEVHKKW